MLLKCSFLLYFFIFLQLINTHTSTSTGKAASRSSSRQLGGNNICTVARVPCESGISNERCVGNANACSRSVYAGRVS